jgi:hypothetical protein
MIPRSRIRIFSIQDPGVKKALDFGMILRMIFALYSTVLSPPNSCSHRGDFEKEFQIST